MENGTAWRAEGSARIMGSEGRFSLLTSDGRAFERTLDGVLSERVLFDGDRGWAWDWNGASRRLELFDLESRILPTWVLTGRWRTLETDRSPDPRESGGRAPRSLRLGRLEATLTLDPTTGEPESLRYASVNGPVLWTFRGHRSWAGRSLPRVVTQMQAGEETLRLELEKVDIPLDAARLGAASFELEDFEFDPDIPRDLLVRRGPHGHLLVEVRLNDGEPSWWILDSGASVSTIAPDLAEREGLLPLGSVTIRSMLGTSRGAIYSARKLSVGPLSIHRLRLAGFDLEPFGDLFGARVGGVLGFDLFRRAQVTVSAASDRVRLRPSTASATGDSAGAEPEDGTRWEPLSLHLGHPVVDGHLEGRPARFRLDLGLGGEGVIVHAPTTSGWNLLDGRKTEATELGGVEARAGRVGALGFAGIEMTDVPAVFAVGGEGPFDDPHIEGTIGLQSMAAHTVLLDYAAEKIGLRRSRWRGKE